MQSEGCPNIHMAVRQPQLCVVASVCIANIDVDILQAVCRSI